MTGRTGRKTQVIRHKPDFECALQCRNIKNVMLRVGEEEDKAQVQCPGEACST